MGIFNWLRTIVSKKQCGRWCEGTANLTGSNSWNKIVGISITEAKFMSGTSNELLKIAADI